MSILKAVPTLVDGHVNSCVETSASHANAAAGRPVPWAAVGSVAAMLAIIALVLWRPWKSALPDVNAGPVALAKFSATQQFAKLPQKTWRTYSAALRRHTDAVVKAHTSRELTAEEYRTAMQTIWLERQLDRMEGYYKLVPGKAREQYLNQLVSRKLAQRKTPAATSKPANSERDGDDDNVDQEKQPFIKARKKRWSEQDRSRWKEFRNLVDARLAASSR